VFGDKTSWQNLVDEDVISTVQFSKNGTYFSLGDNAGRLIVFEYQKTRKRKFNYAYLTELQSHTREFDHLKSQDIEEKLN